MVSSIAQKTGLRGVLPRPGTESMAGLGWKKLYGKIAHEKSSILHEHLVLS